MFALFNSKPSGRRLRELRRFGSRGDSVREQGSETAAPDEVNCAVPPEAGFWPDEVDGMSAVQAQRRNGKRTSTKEKIFRCMTVVRSVE